MTHKILAINRQSGSGGAYIGARVAERLGITCYNKELLDMALEHGGLHLAQHANVYKSADEKRPNLAFYRLYSEGNENVKAQLPASDAVFELQKKLILEISENEDAVIVGRCGNWVLKDEDVELLSVYIVAPTEYRVNRVMVNSEMTEHQAKRFIAKTDRQRADYYYYMTKRHWKGYENYDLIINVGALGEERCIEMLCNYYLHSLHSL